MGYRLSSAVVALFVLFPLFVSSCPNDCSGRGYCRSNGECKCASGYYNNETITDCSYGLADMHSVYWGLIQATCGILWGSIAITAAVGVYYNMVKKKNNRRIYLFNVARNVNLIAAVGFCCQSLVWFIDLGGYRNILPYTVAAAFTYTLMPTAGAVWIGILFHWVELYRYSLKQIKKENMIKAINHKYEGVGTTLDYVLSQVKFLRSLRGPFIVAVALLLIVEVTCMSFGRLYLPVLADVRIAFVTLFWFVVLIGFIIYGRKLTNIMPEELIPKVKKTTRRLTATALSVLLVFTGFAIIGIFVSTPEQYMLFLLGNAVGASLIAILLLSTFMHFHKGFPFCWKSTGHVIATTSEETTANAASVSIHMESSHADSEEEEEEEGENSDV